MDADVQRFVDEVPEQLRPHFDQLQALIMGLYPEAKVVLSYGVPTYRAKSGWVGIGYRKGGVSLYTNGPHHLAEFKAKYPRIKTGEGSIKLKVTEELPLAALEEVIRHAIEHPKPA